MENGNQTITEAYLFKCGKCQNVTNQIYKGIRRKDKKTLTFHALSMAINHKDLGMILFDTGYSDNIYQNGIVSRIYNTLNPATVNSDDYITSKLNKYNFKKEDISKIIISHGHPDHIGGLKFFPNTNLILTKDVYKSMKSANLKELVFKNMVKGFKNKVEILENKVDDNFLSKYFDKVYDIFKDKSIYAIGLEGHSKGQIGIYIPDLKLFVGSDSCWGEEFLHTYQKLKLIPRLVQHNFKEYVDTICRINKFKDENPNIKVIFSHSDFTEGKYEG